nr:AMP-binding protein [Chitinophagaceae bacterium]
MDRIQYKSLEEQQTYQGNELQKTLQYLQLHSPYYRNLFETKSIDISTIKSPADLVSIPTTDKEDLQLHHEEFICVSQDEIIEYSATSGTLGSPVYVAQTQNDLDRLAHNEFLSFQLMELSKTDTVQLLLTLDRQFMAGMAYYTGLRKLGAGIIRSGPGLPSLQIETIKKLRPSTLVAVPSFLLKLIEYCHNEQIDLNTLGIEKVLCIGENIRASDSAFNALAKKITTDWHLKLFGTYACTEMQTAFTECRYGCGGHHQPELLIVEILDNDGNALGAGAYGEVTITTLGVEAMPLLRFRTGDISSFDDQPCACGRKTIRLGPIVGRKKQMIKYKGTTLYPSSLFDMLNHFSIIKEFVVEVFQNELESDELILHIATDVSIDICESKLRPFLQSRLRIIPKIQYHTTEEIIAMQYPNAGRKPIKFLDRRNNNL